MLRSVYNRGPEAVAHHKSSWLTADNVGTDTVSRLGTDERSSCRLPREPSSLSAAEAEDEGDSSQTSHLQERRKTY